MFLNVGLSILSWGKKPMGVLPRVLLLPYLTTNRSVHFQFDTFTHNDHNRKGYFSTNLPASVFCSVINLEVLHAIADDWGHMRTVFFA